MMRATLLVILLTGSPALADEPFDADVRKAAEVLVRGYYRKLDVGELVKAARAGSTVDFCAAIRAMVGWLNDPDTTYFSPAEVAQWDGGCGGIPGSVGVVLEQIPGQPLLRVRFPTKGGPAHRAGVCSGDRVVSVIRAAPNTQPPEPEIISLANMSPYVAARVMGGAPGSRHLLVVNRNGWPLGFSLESVRPDKGRPETLFGVRRGGDAEWDYWLPGEPRLAYVRPDSFQPTTIEDWHSLRRRLEKGGVAGVVLDLRFSPGGLLTGTWALCESLVRSGRVMSIHGQAMTDAENYDVRAGNVPWSVPLVCLVNGGTRSGAEIVAACLQHQRRAVVVGERTAGSGQICNITDLPRGGRLRYTFALTHRADGRKLSRLPVPGRSADEWGVTPDRVVDVPNREREVLRRYLASREGIHPESRREPAWERDFHDRQLVAAVAVLREQLRHR